MPRTEEQNQEIRKKTTDAILASSLRLFSVKGFHGTSISDIAKDAGISKGLVYNYFSSKQSIVDAILREGLEEVLNLEELFKKINDPYEKLHSFITITFSMIKENEDYWRLYFGLMLQPEVIESTTNMSSKFVNMYVAMFEKIFKQIGLKNPNAEARMFISMLDGLALQYFFVKETFPVEKMKKFLITRYSKDRLEKLK